MTRFTIPRRCRRFGAVLIVLGTTIAQIGTDAQARFAHSLAAGSDGTCRRVGLGLLPPVASSASPLRVFELPFPSPTPGKRGDIDAHYDPRDVGVTFDGTGKCG